MDRNVFTLRSILGDTQFYKDFVKVHGKTPLVCVSEFPKTNKEILYEKRISWMFYFLNLPIPGEVVWTKGFDKRLEAVVGLSPIEFFDCNDKFIEATRERGINTIKTSENTEFWGYLDNHEEDEPNTTQEPATTFGKSGG